MLRSEDDHYHRKKSPHDFVHTWWRLFQKLVILSKLDVYVFIVGIAGLKLLDWIRDFLKWSFIYCRIQVLWIVLYLISNQCNTLTNEQFRLIGASGLIESCCLHENIEIILLWGLACIHHIWLARNIHIAANYKWDICNQEGRIPLTDLTTLQRGPINRFNPTTGMGPH